MEKFIAELIEPLLVESKIKSESSKLKKLLSKLRIPKSYIDNQQKLIIYLQNKIKKSGVKPSAVHEDY